jgi:hypothetical protein
VELREPGWSILAAAREVGVSRTTGTTGRVVTERTATVRLSGSYLRWSGWQCSPRFLSQAERIEIADLRHAGLNIRQIAPAESRLRRSRTSCAATQPGVGLYRLFDAHRRATASLLLSERLMHSSYQPPGVERQSVDLDRVPVDQRARVAGNSSAPGICASSNRIAITRIFRVTPSQSPAGRSPLGQ